MTREAPVYQIDLPLEHASTDEAAWDLVLKMVRAIVDEVGLKEVAYDLDVSPSYLSHCLNERERHHVPARWLPYFIRKAKTDDLPAFLAMLRGLQVAPKKTLTPEEKLDRLQRALQSELGDGVRQLVLRRAFGDEK